MNSIKLFKYIPYFILILVVVLSFAITDFLMNTTLQKNGNYVWTIVLIIFNLFLNFSMFFIIFRYTQQLIEKDKTISEFTNQLTYKDKPETTNQEVLETKEVNVDELVDMVIPQSPQNLDRLQFTEKVLSNSSKVCELVQGLFFVKESSTGEFKPYGKYAFYSDNPPKSFIEGETLPGQVAKTKKIITIDNIPENYFTVVSGLGNATPQHLVIVPVINKDETIGVIELATFKPFDMSHIKVFEKLSGLLGKILVKIK
jgi:transcriptional regulator with GAF, ATPase, and Fis domain